MSSYLESLLRGAGQGASLGWSDELGAKLLEALPSPADPEGIPREYAAGSPEEDYLQNFRADNSAAAQENPALYAAGAVGGSLPLALAAPFGGAATAAGRVAASGLTGGALGAIGGAGAAEDEKLKGAGKGALTGAMLGLGGGAAAESLPMLAQAANQGFRQLAPAGAAGAQINLTKAIPPPRRASGTWDMPEIPKAGKNLVPEKMIDATEDLADASMLANVKKDGGKLSAKEADTYANMRDTYNKRFQKERAAEETPKKFEPEAKSGVVETVRPQKRGKAPAKPAEKPVPVQEQLPNIDRNQRSQTDFANAKQRFSDANELFKSAPENVDALKSWVHESRSGASPQLESLQSSAKDYGVGYRGMKLTPEQLNNALQKGEIPHGEMSSWSVNPDTSKAFGNVVLRQTNTKGIPVGRNEGEVLVPPQGSMKIDQVTRDPEGFTHIDVRKQSVPGAEAERELLNQLSLFK